MDFDWETHIRSIIDEAMNDPRTNQELVSQALSEPDEDAAWECVSILHRRGTREVFEAACPLLRSFCSVERTLGAQILGQVGVPNRSFPRESAELLLELLSIETEEVVITSSCFALGHIHDPIAIPALAHLSTHRSEEVRYAVLHGLTAHSDALAIATLIELSTDTDDDVRDWATFALGTQIDDDTPAIRDALLGRTSDSDYVVRGEALVGLARRHDERGIQPLIHELTRCESIEIDSLFTSAAEEYADPRFLSTLKQLKQAVGENDHRFDDAIERCSVGIN